jgi:protein arginine N-methyltransferase 1
MPVSDSYSIRDYGWMINDQIRTGCYVEALRRAVQPGSVVLDIGTGTGIFAILACQFGAARVYAVEPDDAIELAKLCAAKNPGSDRITWLQGFSTEIDLPEKVDIVIGDLRGNLPFHPSNIVSMIDARKRHLKSGGRMIAARDLLRAAPASAPLENKNIASPWWRNEYGIDFSSGQAFVTNAMWRAKPEPIAPENMLSAAETWGSIDYQHVESPNLDGELAWRIERPGTVHGIYVWFDAEVADELGFSNAPDLPTLVYGRTFFPLQEAVDVAPGDRMATRMSATLLGDEYIYRWDTSVTDRAGNLKCNFKQTTFRDRPLKLQELHRASADYVPALTLEGEIDFAIMQAMARSQPLGQIAIEMAARYPKRFSNMTSALGHVAKLSVKYTY